MSESERNPGSEAAKTRTDAGPRRLKKESIWEVYFPVGVREDKVAVPVASFPMIVYFWPSVLAFLLCGAVQSVGEAPSEALGLAAVGVLTLNLLVIVADLDQKKFLIVGLVFLLLVVLGWVAHLKEVAVTGALLSWVASLHVTLSTDAYLLLGGIFLVLFLGGLVQPRFDYWRLEANEFVHYVQPWGRDQSIPRLGTTVSREVPDVLELLLTFGGGTLVMRREGEVVARIDHVPFLGRRMIAIERLLGATRVTSVSEG